MALPTESTALLAEAKPSPPPSREPRHATSRQADGTEAGQGVRSPQPRRDLGAVLRDITIGFSDGLTVPFALTAGLSSLGSARLVIVGGLAELFSGMTSMGLGAYLAAVTERAHQRSRAGSSRHRGMQTRRKPLGRCCLEPSSTVEDLTRQPAAAAAAAVVLLVPGHIDPITSLLDACGLSRATARTLVEELAAHPDRRARFLAAMRCGVSSAADEQGRVCDGPWEEDDTHSRSSDSDDGAPDEAETPAWLSGLTMGLSYFVGGLIPMIPYFLFVRVRDALILSVAVTIFVLLAFGYAKNYIAVRSHRAGLGGAAHTLLIGLLAAGTSHLIVKALDART